MDKKKSSSESNRAAAQVEQIEQMQTKSELKVEQGYHETIFKKI